MIDPDKKITQARFAQIVGITQPAVSGLLAQGVLTVGDNAGNWLLSYCGHLREIAAGRTRQSDDSVDLVSEKARLAAAQADKIEMENNVKKGELAPVAVLEEVLVRAGGKIAAQLDTIPASLKRRIPSLTDSDIGFVRREIAKARNAVANLNLEDVEADENEAK
ncbi:DNA packaging Nu1 [Alcaligenes faecalis]|uniref:terminase small subunit n=1 Tax=Alcaligenes faecalis TaxID=511 RepID=UPI001932DF5C|nr:terminase small subunit [Alcaligenes faecalis]QRF90285.1 DNA packaging Nu1 [Alcaligenes faecalis]